MTAHEKMTHWWDVGFGARSPVKVVSQDAQKGTAVIEQVWDDRTLAKYRVSHKSITVPLGKLTAK